MSINLYESRKDKRSHCVFGHGAHFTRGAEVYHGKPSFYNLGSLFMEFEAGESIISPEMFEAYGYPEDESPSTLYKNRTKDSGGNWQGFYSHKKFSENFMVLFHLDREKGQFEYELIPIDLRLTHTQVTKRGLPAMASKETSDSLIERLNRISKDRYHTEIVYENPQMTIKSLT